MTSTGPFLYDDGPERLHTGAARHRNGFVVAILLGTVLVAVAMVAALWLVRGSPAEQSEEVVGVFLSALDRGDDETAFGLLCEELRAGLEPGEVPAEYQGPNPGGVVGSTETEVDGVPVVEVEVRWADGSGSRIPVVSQDGPRVCGTPAGG